MRLLRPPPSAGAISAHVSREERFFLIPKSVDRILDRFPAQAIVVLADDLLAVGRKACHACVRVRAEFAGLIAVAR
jgi:hypothetical protein